MSRIAQPSPKSLDPKGTNLKRRSQAEYAERDLAVLRFIWRNRIGFNAVLSKKFFAGKPAGHVLRRFAAKGWLQLESGKIPGGISFATLTASGGREIGQQLKPKAITNVNLETAIATSYFTVLDVPDQVRRYRLLPAELSALCDRFAVNVPHVWTDEADLPAVLRIQSAAAGTPREVRRKVAELFAKLETDRATAAWLRTGQYGLAVLGHTPQRTEQLRKVIATDRRFDNYCIVVGLGPTAETLSQVLRSQRDKP